MITIEGGERKKVGPLALNSKKVSGEREGKRRSKEMKDDDRDEDHVKKDRSKLKSSSQEKDDDKAPLPYSQLFAIRSAPNVRGRTARASEIRSRAGLGEKAHQ